MRSGPDATVRLFEDVAQNFDQIIASGLPAETYDIALAGQHIRLEFAGPALVGKIMPALAHIQIAEPATAAPDLTIRLSDAVSTDTDMPQAPWCEGEFTSRREIIGANGPGYRVAYDLYCGIFSITALDRGMAYWWLADAERMPVYESAAPVREILQAWFEDRGGIFAHAAALGNDNGALLLVGRGGAGKSTTALAAADQQLALIGEDYCLLTGCDTQPQVHSLYASAKLSDRSLALLPEYAPLVLNRERGEDDKAVLMMHPAIAMQLAAPVKAIVMPRLVAGGGVRLIPAKPVQALMAIAPSSIMQLSGMGQSAMASFKGLVSNAPSYVLEIGGHPRSAAGVLAGLL